jgi:hypothetical protein
MLFTKTAPTRQEARIYLYFSPEEAVTAAGAGQPIYGVAVHFDGLLRRLLPLEPKLLGPSWTAPAEYQDDGCVVAAAPLPQTLFLS